MKFPALLALLQLVALNALAQRDSVRRRALDEVVYHAKHEKIYTKTFNGSKKALNSRLSYGFSRQDRGAMTRPLLTQELRLSNAPAVKMAQMRSVKCRLEPYDTTVFSLYLVLKKAEGDTQARFFCLNGAKWASGWAVLDFDGEAYPELESNAPFYLGYSVLITDRRYNDVGYAFYQSPIVRYSLFPERERRMQERMERAASGTAERPPNGYPFVVRYAYVSE